MIHFSITSHPITWWRLKTTAVGLFLPSCGLIGLPWAVLLKSHAARSLTGVSPKETLGPSPCACIWPEFLYSMETDFHECVPRKNSPVCKRLASLFAPHLLKSMGQSKCQSQIQRRSWVGGGASCHWEHVYLGPTTWIHLGKEGCGAARLSLLVQSLIHLCLSPIKRGGSSALPCR